MIGKETLTSRSVFPELVKRSGRFFFDRLQKRALESTEQEFARFIVHPALAGLGVCKGELLEKIKGATSRLDLNEDGGLMFDMHMREIIFPLIRKGEDNPYKAHVLRVGRSNDCDVVLADYSISEFHVLLRFSEGRASLIDMRSSNGTEVNGMLLQPREVIELNDGDEVRLGRLLFAFLHPEALHQRLNRTAIPKHPRDLFTDTGKINYSALKAFAMTTAKNPFEVFMKHPVFMGVDLFRGTMLPQLPSPVDRKRNDTMIFSEARRVGVEGQHPITLSILEKSIFILYEKKRRELGENGAILTIGRDPHNDIVMNDSSISKLHAKLYIDEFAYYIEDCGSTNGLRINGRKCGPERQFLDDNDEVRFGRFAFRFVPPAGLFDKLIKNAVPE